MEEEKLFKENDLRHFKKWYLKWWGILIISFFTIFLIFLVASVLYVVDQVSNYKNHQSNSTFTQKNFYPNISKGDHYSFGNKDAKIIIVEFSDFACPNCKDFYEKTKKLRSERYEDIIIIHRDLPIITNESPLLALAARCAGEQGLFWLMHDKLYESQGITSKEEVTKLAENIGVKMSSFTNCLKNNKYIPQIEKDIQDAIEAGVEATPIWFINGYKIMGSPPEEDFNQIINQFINNN